MLSPFAEPSAITALCTSVVALHEERLLAAAGADMHAGKDMIVNIPNIILAFAGRVRTFVGGSTRGAFALTPVARRCC